MFNSNCVVTVKPFNNGTTDKNGKQPVILQIIAGKAPNRMVISGTVAETSGFNIGSVYYANCREVEANEYGRQFRWTTIQEVTSVVDTVALTNQLGNPDVFDVDAKVAAPSVAESTADVLEG